MPIDFQTVSESQFDLDMWGEQARMSLLGTPVFCFCQLTANAKTVALDTVLTDISMSRNIVITPVVGRDGTVKEYVSDGDYKIKIRGALVSQNNKFPIVEVQTLLSILKAKSTVQVSGGIFRLFSIFNIVVTDYSFPQSEGAANTQLFEIDALSDAPIELIPNGNAL